MLDKIKDLQAGFQLFQQLMKDENFRALLAHPKMQELFRDPEVMELMKAKDFTKLLIHPKFAALRQDPELVSLFAKLKP